MVLSPVSTDRDLEVADVRSLVQGADRPRVLSLLADLHDDLMSRTLPESELEDLEELTQRLEPGYADGPKACLMIAGRRLLEDDREVLAFVLVDYFPASRCAMVVAAERCRRMRVSDIWIGTQSITEVLRLRALECAERMAGGFGLKGVFTECRDPDAEGLTGADEDSELAPLMGRSRKARRRIARAQVGWEMVTLPIDYVRPAFGFGGGFPGKIFLCICAQGVRRMLPSRETIQAFLVELWTVLAGRPPSREDEDACRMIQQAAAL